VIAKNHARNLELALRGIGRQPNCKVAAAKAKAVSDKILAMHDRAQEEFDRIEGVNFESRIIRLLRYRMERIEKAKKPGERPGRPGEHRRKSPAPHPCALIRHGSSGSSLLP
jgi:hypothetical protein